MLSQHGGIDEVFTVLSHRHRRQLVLALRDEVRSGGGRKDLTTLTEAIATNGEEKRIRTEMIHCHLPKLEECGYIGWDRDTGTIEQGPEWATLEPVLGVLAEYRTEPTGEAG